MANAAKKQQQQNKEFKMKVLMFSDGGIKDVHDTTLSKKYVSKEMADAFCDSPYTYAV